MKEFHRRKVYGICKGPPIDSFISLSILPPCITSDSTHTHKIVIFTKRLIGTITLHIGNVDEQLHTHFISVKVFYYSLRCKETKNSLHQRILLCMVSVSGVRVVLCYPRIRSK